jgi:hypothetical protein
MNPRILLSAFLVFVGLILVLDELGNGWILGDWSFFHLEPFHHWMLGVLMTIAGLALLRS